MSSMYLESTASHERTWTTVAACIGSLADLARHPRRGLFSRFFLVGLLGVCGIAACPGCLQPVAIADLSVEQHGFAFEQHELVIGSARCQTVLTGCLLEGSMADLAVVNIDENGDRLLRVYELVDGTWSQSVRATLGPEVLFVDVVDIAGRERLLTYEPDRLNWFDPEAMAVQTLVTVSTQFNPDPGSRIRHVDVTRDVNSDGRDDLVVPDADGFWVFVQLEGGVFAGALKVGPSFDLSRIEEAGGYRYDPWSESRLHEMDYDLDGRKDLVYWNENHFDVHRQDERGTFSSTTERFTTEVAFGSDDHAALAAPQGIRRRRFDHMPTGAMAGSVLHSLNDVNGDGIADLAVFTLEIGGMWSGHSIFEVYFGSRTTAGRTAFASEVGTAIHADGIPFGMALNDFNGDGQLDLLFTNLKLGPLKTIGMLVGAMFTKSMSLALDFYCMEGGDYTDEPSVTREIEKHTPGVSGQRAVHPSVLIGDVNGDHLPDLLVQDGREELHVYLGVPGSELFTEEPRRVAVAMPHEDYTWLVDLDSDGKQDILMHQRSSHHPDRVLILIAK